MALLNIKFALPKSDGLSEDGLADARATVSTATNSNVPPSAEKHEELAQAKVRCVLNFALMLLALLSYQHNPELGLPRVWLTFAFTITSAVFLYVWARLISKPDTSRASIATQRVCCIVLDNIAITWILHFGGEALAGIVGIYLWITLGYGMRYGLRYLFGNLAVSVVGFSIGAYFTPYWRDQPSLSLGLALTLVIVPAYAAFLIKRLHQAVRGARAAYDAKSSFIAKMSHELRTPLHGIISTTDLLGQTKVSTEQHEMIRIISVSSNTLLDLINRILDISKFEAGTFILQKERMDLHLVLCETVNILWPEAIRKGLDLHFFTDIQIPNWIFGSPRQLQEVLVNLGGNAIKFTDTGRVSIKVVPVRKTPNVQTIRFEISDNGPGISKEAIERIFDPFVQGDNSTTRKHGGTGLGTAISRELTRLMGGDIQVESILGVGSVFSVELPFEIAPVPENVHPIYRGSVVALGYHSSYAELGEAFGKFGAEVVLIDQLDALDTACFRAGNLAAVIIDADQFGGRIRNIKRSIAKQLGGTLVAVIASGCDKAKEEAIAAGCATFIESISNSQEVERALNIAAMLRKEYLPERDGQPSTSPLRILVAEDNPTNQTIARLTLEGAGHDCLIVENGQAALDALQGDIFDLAIVDMHMPIFDGVEVARIYNFSIIDANLRIPIIMMTADNRAEVIADAELAGVCQFLVKPLRPAVLLNAIERVMRERSKAPAILSFVAQPVTPWQASTVEDEALSGEGQQSALIDPTIVDELLGYMSIDERGPFFGEFLADASGYIATLDGSISEEQLDAVRGSMHSLSGASRTIGAIVLAKLARRIEYMNGSEIRSTGQALHDELRETLNRTFSEMRGYADIGI